MTPCLAYMVCSAKMQVLSLYSFDCQNFKMFVYSPIAATLAATVGATGHSKHNDTHDSTVKIQTGTFISDLNDTHPDVRQSEWIPHVKASIPFTIARHSL